MQSTNAESKSEQQLPVVSYTLPGAYMNVLLRSVFDIKVKDLLRPPPNQNQHVCPKASFDQGEERES